MASLAIRDIVTKVEKGEIRVPAFQRGFVWDPEMVAKFIDSIYKGYPYGSLLLWRTRESLKSERNLGPFELPAHDPHYPIDYVLDGQQRVTSLFGVFQTELQPASEGDWFKIYFDFRADPSIQESQFIPLADHEVDLTRHFPLSTLFDTVPYRRATSGLPDDDIIQIDKMQARFKEAQIPYQMTETDNRASVAIIFERINRNGVPLDTLQLLSAWTWSEDFDLQEKFSELSEDIRHFGFGGQEVDPTLLLRCCAAVIVQDASPESLVNIDGELVRTKFSEVSNGIKGAIDFLRSEFHIESIINLPFVTMLVPLSTFFALPDGTQHRMTNAQTRAIRKWFWKSCFSRRYSSAVLRNLKTDIEEMIKLRNQGRSALGDFGASVDSQFFLGNRFGMRNVNTKTFILLLAQQRPLSFISGRSVSLAEVLKEYNRNEFHHVFPKKHLADSYDGDLNDSVLANLCFMSRSDNNQLGGVSPQEYRS